MRQRLLLTWQTNMRIGTPLIGDVALPARIWGRNPL